MLIQKYMLIYYRILLNMLNLLKDDWNLGILSSFFVFFLKMEQFYFIIQILDYLTYYLVISVNLMMFFGWNLLELMVLLYNLIDLIDFVGFVNVEYFYYL